MFLYDTEVEILVNGKPVKKYSHNNKTYIQANKGSAYSIRIKNNSWNRRLFVVSVDGINVLNGQPAGSSPHGYVIGGYSSYEVLGFRTSNEEVHPFKFNDKDKSYAAKSEETGGDVSNCGVIGVQVYEEKPKVPIYTLLNLNNYPITPITNTSASLQDRRRFSYNACLNSSFGGLCSSSLPDDSNMDTLRCLSVSNATCSVSEPAFEAGTEFSKESVVDKVVDTQFEVGVLTYSIEIFYAYRDGLLNMGVPVNKEVQVATPNPFPSRFCKLPKD